MLSIILPTYNESANLPELFERVTAALKGKDYEIIVVDDDSPDKTWQVAERLREDYPMVRVLHRVGHRGLSSAVVEGFDMAKGTTLLVMDADLQHDPLLIGQLSQAIDDGADIAVASRYIKGGSVGSWVTGRRLLSKAATFLARKLPLVESSDPMSGFFALRTSMYRTIRPQLRPSGFKILFEVLAFLPRTAKITEVPLEFHMRKHGESKLSMGVEMQFLLQLARVALHRAQKALWWIVIGIVAMVVVLHAVQLFALYADADVRTQVQTMIEQLSAERGWLVSDIELTAVDTQGIGFTYHAHHRGTDEEACYEWQFTSPEPLPCNAD